MVASRREGWDRARTVAGNGIPHLEPAGKAKGLPQRTGPAWVRMATMPNKPLDVIQELISAYVERGDPRRMLADGVFALAAQAFESAKDSEGMIDLRVVRTLAWLHWYRYRADSNQDEDLQTATQLFAMLASFTPDEVPQELRGLAVADAAVAAGATVNLTAEQHQQVIEHCRRAVHAATRDDQRAKALLDLGTVLWFKYEQNGDRADLDELIDVDKSVVDLTTPEHPKHASTLSELCIALRERYNRTGDRPDLDEAIRFGRVSIESLPPGHPDRAANQANLASTLGIRFELRQNLLDLDESIGLISAAILATEPDRPERPTMLAIRAAARLTRFGITDDIRDLDDAIDSFRQATRSTSVNVAGRAMYYSNLGIALRARFRKMGDATDLDLAVDHHRRAVTLRPAPHPEGLTYIANLGAALGERYKNSRRSSDADEAIGHLRRAIATTPTNGPDWASHQHNLGSTHWLRFEAERTGPDAEAALAAWAAAAGSTAAKAATRVHASAKWGDRAADLGRWSAAADGYAAGIAVLPQLAWPGVARASQERLLTESLGLAVNAAACAIHADQPDRSIELLEHGHSVLWSQLLDARSDITDLQHAAPQLAARMAAIRAELDRMTDKFPSVGSTVHIAP